MAATAFAASALVVTATPAAATTEQVTILSPVDGFVSSRAGQHHIPYGGDWSTDIASHGGAAAAVHARFKNPTGTLKLEIISVGRACKSPNDGGEAVKVRVSVDGVNLGWVLYSHLTSIPKRSGVIGNGDRIGTLATGLPNNADCWTGPHVHLEPRNEKKFSCFNSLTGNVTSSTTVGIIGGEHAGAVNQACPAGAYDVGAPPPPPPAASPVVSVTPESGDKTTVFQGGASGFTANGTATLTVTNPDGSAYPTGNYTRTKTADGAGKFSWKWFWESGDQYGAYKMSIKDNSSGKSHAVSFTINAARPAYGHAAASNSWRNADGTAADSANLHGGKAYRITISVPNAGTETWQSTGSNPVRLGTDQPRDHSSALHYDDSVHGGRGNWVSANRIHLNEANGSTVAPGSSGAFTFSIVAPRAAGQFSETFRPVVDGISWSEGPLITLAGTVTTAAATIAPQLHVPVTFSDTTYEFSNSASGFTAASTATLTATSPEGQTTSYPNMTVDDNGQWPWSWQHVNGQLLGTWTFTGTDDSTGTTSPAVQLQIREASPAQPRARNTDTVCPVPSSSSFDDVEDNVHRPSIECVAHHQITIGQSSRRYGTKGLVTRGQLATFLSRTIVAAGATLPSASSVADAYDDDNGSTHEGSLNVMAHLGIFDTATRRVRPAEPIERWEMSRAVARAATYMDVLLDPSPPDYYTDDGNVADRTIDQISAAMIVTGQGGGVFAPNRQLQRDQMATFLARLLDVAAAYG